MPTAISSYLDGGLTTATYTQSSFHQSVAYDLAGGVRGVVSTSVGSNGETISYQDSAGRMYSTYDEALNGNNLAPDSSIRPRARPAAADVVLASSTSGGTRPAIASSSNGGSSSDGASSGGASSNGGSASTTNNGGTVVTNGQQQVAYATSPDYQGGGGSSGGITSNFSNPFGNSSIDLSGGIQQSGTSSGTYSGTADQSSGSSFGSEGVGGDGGGSNNGSSSGGGVSGGGSSGRHHNAGGSSGGSSSSSGGARVSTASLPSGGRAGLGPGVTPGVDVDRADTRIATASSLDGGQFQSGFHKAPELDASGRPLTPQEQERRRRLRRQRVSNDCRGDMQCIARILGRSGRASRRGGRGLASTDELPQCVWRGYGDILNHMAQFHDRMALDHEGGVEGYRQTTTDCTK